MDLEKYYDQGVDLVMTHGPGLLLALITLFVGLRIISFALKLVDNGFEKSKIDPTLRPFLHSLVGSFLKIMLFISVAAMVGIATTSFVAIIGAAGLAVGLSLQGTLANFAGGVLILIFKPYEVGHFIEAQGFIGTVKEIKIFVTILTTPQNRIVIIPNAAMSNGSLTNYSIMDTVRIDLTIGISYDASIKEAKDILLKICENDKKVLKTPAPQIVVGELGDSSVNIHVRPWVKTPDYWDTYFAILEECKLKLDEAGIGIPYPQTDVHLHQVEQK
jgi:small conductance mechanosensitive channel